MICFLAEDLTEDDLVNKRAPELRLFERVQDADAWLLALRRPNQAGKVHTINSAVADGNGNMNFRWGRQNRTLFLHTAKACHEACFAGVGGYNVTVQVLLRRNSDVHVAGGGLQFTVAGAFAENAELNAPARTQEGLRIVKVRGFYSESGKVEFLCQNQDCIAEMITANLLALAKYMVGAVRNPAALVAAFKSGIFG